MLGAGLMGEIGLCIVGCWLCIQQLKEFDSLHKIVGQEVFRLKVHVRLPCGLTCNPEWAMGARWVLGEIGEIGEIGLCTAGCWLCIQQVQEFDFPNWRLAGLQHISGTFFTIKIDADMCLFLFLW